MLADEFQPLLKRDTKTQTLVKTEDFQFNSPQFNSPQFNSAPFNSAERVWLRSLDQNLEKLMDEFWKLSKPSNELNNLEKATLNMVGKKVLEGDEQIAAQFIKRMRQLIVTTGYHQMDIGVERRLFEFQSCKITGAEESISENGFLHFFGNINKYK